MHCCTKTSAVAIASCSRLVYPLVYVVKQSRQLKCIFLPSKDYWIKSKILITIRCLYFPTLNRCNLSRPRFFGDTLATQALYVWHHFSKFLCIVCNKIAHESISRTSNVISCWVTIRFLLDFINSRFLNTNYHFMQRPSVDCHFIYEMQPFISNDSIRDE